MATITPKAATTPKAKAATVTSIEVTLTGTPTKNTYVLGGWKPVKGQGIRSVCIEKADYEALGAKEGDTLRIVVTKA